MNSSGKIVIMGGAGLVGQNLTIKLIEAGYKNLLVVDKSQANLAVLRQLHPEVSICCADISEDGEWTSLVDPEDTIVMLQAQIGGLHLSEFERNNLLSTRRVLEICKQKGITRIIHVSSSVVNSAAEDFYTQTKTSQENMVLQSNMDSVILRPTLMFGWFDRKHLGWLSRFMKKVPVFPIPGDGRYMRQPLYVGDFADVLLSCIRDSSISGIYDISGLEKIDYIDIIKSIRDETRSRAIVIKIPYKTFQFLLNLWAKFDSNPPFTKQQLEALVTRDDFEVIDWPSIFQVSATPFRKAIHETFNHPSFSKVVLEF
jgi:nucleoside-diphosphate-sugar epimerase